MHSVHRRLDIAERFFWFLDQVSCTNFAVIAEGQRALSNAAVRRALERLQRNHPLLNVSINLNTDGHLYFTPAPAMKIDYEHKATGDWRAVLSSQLVVNFALDESPLLRARRFDRPDGSWVLALIVHHAIADGRAGFLLLDELLSDLAGQPSSSGKYHPAPSFAECLPNIIANVPLDMALHRLRAARKALAREIPVTEIAAHRYVAGPVKHHFLSLDLTISQVAALIRQVRAQETTVSSLICAVQLLALRSLISSPDSVRLGLTVAVDLGAHLQPAVDRDTTVLYASLLSGIHDVDTKAFWPLARAVREHVLTQIANGAAALFYHLTPPHADTLPSEESVSELASQLARAPQSSVMTNVGVLSPLAGAATLGIAARSFVICPGQRQLLIISVSSHEQGMRIHLNYNPEQLPACCAMLVQRRMEAMLHASLLPD